MKRAAIQISSPSLHQQVTNDLLARLQSGGLQPGDAIPTETELCREYGVSRITVRRAVAELVARRLVTRRRGVGSFVTGRSADRREFHLVGFLDDKLEFDQQAICNVVEHADERIASALGLEPGTPVRHIRAVVHRDGEPFTVADVYTADLPDRRVSELDFGTGVPAAQKMGQRLGQQISRAEQELDAMPADAVAAQHLGITVGTPIIQARRTYYSAGDKPVQYWTVRYHPDRYRFVVDLVPRAGTSAFIAVPERSLTTNQT